MHQGWLRLTKPDGGRVFIWAIDAEMIEEDGIWSVVYLHHDKIQVTEKAEFIIGEIDRIAQQNDGKAE